MSFYFRLKIKKWGPLLFFSFELCPPPRPNKSFLLETYIYIIQYMFSSEKPGLGVGGTMFTRPWNKYLSVTGSRMSLKHVPRCACAITRKPKQLGPVVQN